MTTLPNGVKSYNGLNEKAAVAEMMERYGGSFVTNLGVALLYADPENTRKIKETWPELWARYKRMAKIHYGVEKTP